MFIAQGRHAGQYVFLARLQLNDSSLDEANPDFGTLKILKDGYRLFERLAYLLDAPDDGAVVLVCTVREVNARHIHTCGNELLDHVARIGGRTDRANDFCTSHAAQLFSALRRSTSF